MKKDKENNLIPLLKKQTKKSIEAFGKYGPIVQAINENTKQLRELTEIIKDLKKTK